MTKKYMFKLIGGEYEWSWEKITLKVFTSKDTAIDEAQKLMVEKGCKKKNLQVMFTDNKPGANIVEIRNRHKADLECSSDDIPMTGYVFEVEMVD